MTLRDGRSFSVGTVTEVHEHWAHLRFGRPYEELCPLGQQIVDECVALLEYNKIAAHESAGLPGRARERREQ